MNVVNQPIVKHKLGLLNLAQELGNVPQVCKVMGVSRDTFYRYQEARACGRLDALPHKHQHRPNLKIGSRGRCWPTPLSSWPAARCV
ncbi:MAG: helix-turn-helix domain-containing protein [Gammaproteobacteria bacterium]|nr:helix-turn-helix domain-containing protein [Gammaproteobacteria bacterium]